MIRRKAPQPPKRPLMRSFTAAAALAVFGLLSGCSFDTVADRINPYRIDVRQGNYVDQAMVSQLKRGMTPEQVRFVLGTPLVVDMFRENRWDYVYLFQPGRGEPERRVISVFFDAGLLDRLEGDVVAGDGVAAAPEGRSRVIEIPAPEAKK